MIARRPLAIGIDVGGTKTAVVVTDALDELLCEETVLTDRSALGAQLVGLVGRTIDRLEASHDGVAAVGLAVPGHVNAREGTVRMAVNLASGEMPLGAIVRESTGLPTVVEHDARAAAAWLYERDRTRDLAYLSVGTGISAGLVLDGRLLRGATGLAGEIGHIVADPDGPLCVCGLHGCLEAVAAGPAIARLARERMREAGTAGAPPTEMTAQQVFAAATRGERPALSVIETVAGHLARAIRALVLGFGVDRVVVGGGVAGAGDALLQPILSAIGWERHDSALVDSAFATTSIELLPPDTNAGARGAATIARGVLAGSVKT